MHRSPSPTAVVITVLASCAGTAAAAGLALEWFDGRPASGLGVHLALGALVVTALALAIWAARRRGKDDPGLHALPTIVLAPEPGSTSHTAPPVSRVAFPRKRTGVAPTAARTERA